MSFISRITKNSKFRPQTALIISRNYSYSNDDWKAGNTLPISLSWSSLKTRMEGGADRRGPFSSFGGVVKYADDGTADVRQSQSTTPLGKIMEDKQAHLNSEGNYMVSLDPNTSMWRNVDHHAERSTTPERKEEISSNIHAFYKKRWEELEKHDETKNVYKSENKPGITSLYHQISRRAPRYGVNQNEQIRQNFDAVSKARMQEEESITQVNQKEMAKQRPNPYENDQYNEEPQLYKTLGRSNKKQQMMNDTFYQQFERNVKSERHSSLERPIDRTRFERGKRMPVEMRGHTNERRNKNVRRTSEEMPQEESLRNDKLEYAVYDDTPRASPVFTSPHRSEEEQQEKSNHWRYRDNDEINERKSDKYQAKGTATQYSDSDDTGFMGSYSTANPPEPLFKPSSSIATAKMKFFAGNWSFDPSSRNNTPF